MIKAQKQKLYLTIFLGIVLVLLLTERWANIRLAQHIQDPVQEPFVLELKDQNLSVYAKLNHQAKKVGYPRDPFYAIPVVLPPAQPKFLGVLWDQDKPLVLFDDRILQIGSEINGHKIVDIKKESVILNAGSENRELSIGQSIE